MLVLFFRMWSKVWGAGLSHGYAGQPSNFQLNPNGVSLSGITFAIVGKTFYIKQNPLFIAPLAFIT